MKKQGFFSKIKTSWNILLETFKSIKKYPILLLPIFLTWIVIASLVIYLDYYATFPDNETVQWVIIIGIFWFVTFVLTYSSAVMVSFVKQIETVGKATIGEAFSSANKKIVPLLGLSFIWAVIWILLTIIEAILRKGDNNRSSGGANYESIAKTLGGEGSVFGWLTFGLDVLKDLLRLAVFLSVPAILWKNKGTIGAIKEGGKIIGRHPTEFLGIYGSMFLIVLFMVLPIAIIFFMSNNGTQFPDYLWAMVIIYEGIVWTFSIYMEQMSATLLFLWDMKWQKVNSEIENKEEQIPLSKIDRPSLTDDVLELAN